MGVGGGQAQVLLALGIRLWTAPLTGRFFLPFFLFCSVLLFLSPCPAPLPLPPSGDAASRGASQQLSARCDRTRSSQRRTAEQQPHRQVRRARQRGVGKRARNLRPC